MVEKVLKIISIVACIAWISWLTYTVAYTNGFMDGADFVLKELGK